ncbi:FAD-dependent oxidoreductase [Mycobacterium sp. NPDC003449]
MTDVIVVGAGPTGLMLATELVRGGASVELIDRAPARAGTSRAAGMNARTMEVLDQRGMLEAFEARGTPMDAGHFSGLRLDMSALPTRRGYTLAIMQTETESVLEQAAADLGVTVQWNTELTGLEQDATGVTVTTTGPGGAGSRRASYVVGCDGSRSAVRGLAAIPFDGTEAELVTLLGDVEVSAPPPGRAFLERLPAGVVTMLPFGHLSGQTWHRVMVTEYEPADREPELSIDGLRAALNAVAGKDFGIHSPSWLSRFADASRQARHYRAGRTFLAGDAAHIHPPLGGQGMNLGMQDAVNLGWKLAAVIRGEANAELLDTYHAERHPVAQRVLENTRAQTALLAGGAKVTAMREMLGGLFGIDAVNERVAAEISGLDVHYPSGADHVLVGRRIPDCDIMIDGTLRRLYELLHKARPVLIDFGSGLPGAVEAMAIGRSWRLPVVDRVPVPAAVLLRPDGHVAWVSVDGSSTGLRRAAERIGAAHLVTDGRSAMTSSTSAAISATPSR